MMRLREIRPPKHRRYIWAVMEVVVVSSLGVIYWSIRSFAWQEFGRVGSVDMAVA